MDDVHSSGHDDAVVDLDLVEIDAGDGGTEDVRTAADALRARTDIVGVVAALSREQLTALALALDDTEAAILVPTDAPDDDRSVALRSTPEYEAELAGTWIGSELRAAQPAVLTATQDLATQEVYAFARSVDRYGQKSIHQTFPFTKTGGVDPLGELASGGVDAVYTPSSYAHVGRALREAQLHQLRASFVVPSAWDTADTRDLVAHSGVRAYVLVPFAADDTDERVARFVDTFRQKAGAPPDVAAAMAYEAVHVVVAAMDASADPLDAGSVRASLHGIAGVPGLLGPIAIDTAGRARRAYAVRELHGGRDAIAGRVE
jgi:branched-chain amino acid transport system substrate-binding protein